MGLFKKKETQQQASKAQDLPDLPTFPVMPKDDTLNQQVVKSAVSDTVSLDDYSAQIPGLEDLNIDSQNQGTGELPALEPISAQEPSIGNLNLVQQSPIPEPPKPLPQLSSVQLETSLPQVQQPIESVPLKPSLNKQTEPIFVRIDKFQEAQKDFDEIRSKIIEIEKVIGKIKEVKSQEEKELEDWSKEIEQIKQRLIDIDSNVFNQV